MTTSDHPGSRLRARGDVEPLEMVRSVAPSVAARQASDPAQGNERADPEDAGQLMHDVRDERRENFAMVIDG